MNNYELKVNEFLKKLYDYYLINNTNNYKEIYDDAYFKQYTDITKKYITYNIDNLDLYLNKNYFNFLIANLSYELFFLILEVLKITYNEEIGDFDFSGVYNEFFDMLIDVHKSFEFLNKVKGI